MALKRQAVHYVNNAEFSQAVVDYVSLLNVARDAGQPLPIVTDYIASCFLKIAEGLSHKSNFIRYTFREEMVMDGVENCLKAIGNYNIEAATRTGKPNAFAYFTQISFYAFLRRIAKEAKQQTIKMKYMTTAGMDAYAVVDLSNPAETAVVMNFVDTLKSRIDVVKDHDTAMKEFASEERARERKRNLKSSDEDIDND